MSDVMKAVGSVTKNQTNSHQGFKFRGIDQFVNALYPALTANGVFMAPECVSEEHELKEVTRSNGKVATDKHVTILMKYHFYAEDGSSVTVGPLPAEGLDSGDKATNKALSAALKYALIQTFSIPTEDMAEADLESPTIGTVVSPKSPSNSPYSKTEASVAEVTSVASTNAGTNAATVSAAPEAAPKTTYRKPTKKAAAAPTTPEASNGSGDGWN